MKKAFSLIELLISLVAISIIVAAFVPIVTKKMSKSNMVVKVAAAKKGLQIYTNPGTYSYDVPEGVDKVYFSGAAGGGGGAGASKTAKNVTITTSQTWQVPVGVNKISFTITASGGGGGGGYAEIKTDPCKYRLTLSAMADSGKDLCVATPTNAQVFPAVSEIDTVSVMESACWKPRSGHDTASPCMETSWPSASPYFEGGGCKKILCTNQGALHLCQTTVGDIVGESWRYYSWRLFYVSELKRLFIDSNASNNYYWIFGRGLDLGMHKYSTIHGNKYTTSNATSGCVSPISGECSPYSLLLMDGKASMTDIFITGSLDGTINFEANGVSYGGAGGTGQVRCVRELNNWLQHSGSGGLAGQQQTYTLSVLPKETLEITIGQGGAGGTAGRTGSKGAVTKVVYTKLNGAKQTFELQGADGGQGATATASGAGATDTTGGKGGVIAGSTAQAASGGTLDGGAVGQNATTPGFGGGGGTCARGIRNPGSCSSGGKGASGKVDISYDLITPGGGGGAGASVAEIEYKVTPGERLVFTIGKGGDGGASSQIGKAGTATTIMENHIIFNPGLEGRFGAGGAAGNLKINSSKAKLPIVQGVTASNVGLGLSGENGKALSDNNYGFNGGSGGTSFLGYFGGCGGGVLVDPNTLRACQTPSRQDGVEAKTHNAVKNEYGGSGGGGGGVLVGNSTLGAGSSGSDGYLRIRWGEE